MLFSIYQVFNHSPAIVLVKTLIVLNLLLFIEMLVKYLIHPVSFKVRNICFEGLIFLLCHELFSTRSFSMQSCSFMEEFSYQTHFLFLSTGQKVGSKIWTVCNRHPSVLLVHRPFFAS